MADIVMDALPDCLNWWVTGYQSRPVYLADSATADAFVAFRNR